MHPPSAYRHAIRAAPILSLGGLIATAAGNIADKLWLFRVGASVFLSGFVVWGFANGYLLICGLNQSARRSGFRSIVAHPWSLAIYVILALFFFSIGAFFLWFIVSTTIHPN